MKLQLSDRHVDIERIRWTEQEPNHGALFIFQADVLGWVIDLACHPHDIPEETEADRTFTWVLGLFDAGVSKRTQGPAFYSGIVVLRTKDPFERVDEVEAKALDQFCGLARLTLRCAHETDTGS